jgi:hypothetical protein
MLYLTGSGSDDQCKRVQELLVWMPAGALEKAERADVERHAAECPACADLLKFASTLRECLLEEYSPHPSAEALVTFAEAGAVMEPQVRSRIEEHLAACPDCRDEVTMLGVVDQDASDVVSSAGVTGYAQGLSRGLPFRLRLLWASLRRGMLRPVPAAFYLVLAAVGIGLYLAGPARQAGRIPSLGESGIGVLSTPSGAAGRVGGIVILADQTSRLRRPGERETEAAGIDAGGVQFLLLELTGLRSPPAAEDRYSVEFLKEGSLTPVIAASVVGRQFSDNYTLCLSLEPGALTSGAYTVRVVSPDGHPVFRSSIIVR